jgi:outer membrane lipoprotein-sorting protein
MVKVPLLSRRARWAVPIGALVITGSVIAGSLVSAAQAVPGLPARTPAQLLAQVAGSTAPPLSGTVVQTASFGLPSLPGTDNPTSLSWLLTGSHTLTVWYASPEHFRLSVPAPLSETDLVRDGSTAWLWQSRANSVTEFSLPAHRAAPAAAPVLTPQQAAQQVLAAVGPTTSVSVASNVTVAGKAAYELVLAPKDARSLVGQVQIAIDGSNGVPLRLQVFARGASSPAFTVGYTSVQFATPPSSDLSFTPPPSATITRVNASGERAGADHAGAPAGTDHAAPGIGVTGSGWLTVLELPSAALTAPSGAAGAGGSGGPVSVNNTGGDSAAVISALLASATPVHGAWGTGRLLRTSLVSVLMTDGGRTFIGAVQPSVLYAAAAQAPLSAATP